MPPNKGGKRYKKGKHGGEVFAEMVRINESEGQMLGRVIKSVGDRRFAVYCNDNKERLCRLRGSFRKNTWIEKGSIVLLSLRSFSFIKNTDNESKGDMPPLDTLVSKEDKPLKEEGSNDESESDSDSVDTEICEVKPLDKLGDILFLVDPSTYNKVKKLPGVNLILFENLEGMETSFIQRRVDKMSKGIDENEAGFIFDADADMTDTVEKNGEEEKGTDLTKEDKKLKEKVTDLTRNKARLHKHVTLDEL